MLAGERQPRRKSMSGNTLRFSNAIGLAALELWPDLPRDVQARLFEHAATAGDNLRHALAVYLHDRHPRSIHPPKPTALA
jgi:hypothetical protein